MRVIAGRAKGHRLAGPPSRATRPTSDLVRGASLLSRPR
ncbi:MAG: RsmD family RNA methyltransferase [Chloroflexi bacterium]|nr:RsmD family RNA methyltransferase [Chloroflexota bacterium]